MTRPSEKYVPRPRYKISKYDYAIEIIICTNLKIRKSNERETLIYIILYCIY